MTINSHSFEAKYKEVWCDLRLLYTTVEFKETKLNEPADLNACLRL